MKKDFMFTSESVTEGHPDKLCDQISDAIVDRFLQQNPYARVMTECAVSQGIVFIAARFEPNDNVDFTNIARHVIEQVGYEQSDFNGKNCSILTSLTELHPEPYHLFNEKNLSDEEIEKITVNNQATVFGFACNQTDSLMPLPIWLAHKLARQISTVRRQKILPYLTPDGKTQVGVEYKNRRPDRIHSITVLASQDKPSKPDWQQLQNDIRETVISPVFENEDIKPDAKTRIFINPYGPFIVGGPAAHAGLTGRKNAIDTYGEYSKHSGSALSGKDPIRIDRIGAYAARYAAKNIVSAKLAQECEVQLSYSIGLSRPVSIQIETFGTGKISDEEITRIVEKNFDFRLAGIINKFNLRFLPSLTKGGFYRKLAAYGHVGRIDLDLPWEKVDKVGVFLA
ncbi:methionine adenosyltransferase [Cylindrospermum sp. FACHB-282]|uniref:methionine adenosyltransferase n=1 Tax=Cylindrospermum sp. FACHB-282 TaxID=2692794 RepID=UPI0016839D1E|nr:methionine adenosyltransferase [Cylindrospermum sp. FACHB-282]MBD2388429.1 methionine adenosyltransferase [Cylindrospermum sp. FACHB-282]